MIKDPKEEGLALFKEAVAIKKAGVIDHILDSMEVECYNVWRASKSVEEREEAHAQLQTLTQFREKLNARAEDRTYRRI